MSDFSPPDVTEMRRHAWQRPAGTDAASAGDADSFGFWDLVDIVNPLQHIPVVSTIYRQITGDEIRPEARIMGSTLYGGPIGLAVAAAGAIVEQASGRTVEEHALAMLGLDEETPAPVEYAALPAEPAADRTAAGAAAAPAPADRPAKTAAVTETSPPAASDAEASAAGERRTADLPNGFPLSPRSYAAAPALPPAAPSIPETHTLRGAPGEKLAIGTDLDAALARLAAESAATAAAKLQAPEAAPESGTTGDEDAEAPDAELAAGPSHPLLVPESGVPSAMMRALDLYGQFRSSSAVPALPGLDMRT